MAEFIVDVTREGLVTYEQTEGSGDLTPWDAATLARALLDQAATAGAFQQCRGCHAPIAWAKDAEGRPRPLDIGDHPNGNCAAWRDGDTLVMRYLSQAQPLRPGDGERRVMAHHASCPARDQFRKRTA
jgi:hypothetical protein